MNHKCRDCGGTDGLPPDEDVCIMCEQAREDYLNDCRREEQRRLEYDLWVKENNPGW